MSAQPIYVGADVGASRTKVAVLDAAKTLIGFAVQKSGTDFTATADDCLQQSLAMAGAGYYIQAYGGNWGTTLQLAFLTGAGVLLLTLLFSGQLRARALVLLSKHFFNYKSDYR